VRFLPRAKYDNRALMALAVARQGEIGRRNFVAGPADIAPGAVQDVHIRDNAVQERHLGPEAVTGRAIAPYALNEGHMGDNTIVQRTIAPRALVDRHVADDRAFVASGVVDTDRNIDFNAGAGWVNKNLDNLADGASYLRVTGVSAGHQVQAGSIATDAVTTTKIADDAVAPVKVTVGDSYARSLVKNSSFVHRTKG